MKKDYSLLRPFDLLAATRGEPICDRYGTEITYVAGPDAVDDIVYLYPNGNREFSIKASTNLRLAPLCWVEGRPVYRGDVLYWYSGSRPVKFTAGDQMIDDEIICGISTFDTGETMGDDGFSGVLPGSLTWTPPKVKREGFVVVNKASVFNSRKQAEAYRDSFLENTSRFIIGRVEWEE